MSIRSASRILLAALAVACTNPPLPESVTTPPPAAAPGAAAGGARPLPTEPARLVVVLVVDQLRSDLLGRNDSLWTGGFRRLMDEGRYYIHASHAFAATVTAAGHATLSTGTHPSSHGIVGNSWWERSGRRWVSVENIDDSTVTIVGHPKLPGVSPVHLERSGLAEWMLAADARSLVASVSGKDRGAVQPAAHAKGHVYWFEEAVGRFVTSTYYRDAYPEWVDRFHETVLPRYADDTVWTSEVPARARGAALADTADWEGDGEHTYFPHRFAAEARPNAYWAWFAGTPPLDALTLDFAETMVTSLSLGGDEAVDFLNVSLSQTDRVGHAYGPHSLEQLDNLLRLDRELGGFFAFLDSAVGRGRWIAGFSADHGVLDTPEELRARGRYGHRATKAEIATMDSLAVVSNRRAANDPEGAATRLVDALKKLPWVADAWTHERLLKATPRDSFAVLFRRSLYPGREIGWFGRQGVAVRFVEGFIVDDLGTGHGAPYWHDRHVPMVFMGPGIPPGLDPSTGVFTVDFAPTLARLIGVKVPEGTDGKPLVGVVGR
jgi:predicted AlkP superfamily pyrophosphatase or phosphodiesterase